MATITKNRKQCRSFTVFRFNNGNSHWYITIGIATTLICYIPESLVVHDGRIRLALVSQE